LGVWSTFERGRGPGESKTELPAPDVVEFARTRLGFEPDERQAELLGSAASRGFCAARGNGGNRQWRR